MRRQVQNPKQWHKWFAWYPITIKNHAQTAREQVLFENVERRRGYDEDTDRPSWIYRTIMCPAARIRMEQAEQIQMVQGWGEQEPNGPAVLMAVEAAEPQPYEQR